jgi:hypothetical protein
MQIDLEVSAADLARVLAEHRLVARQAVEVGHALVPDSRSIACVPSFPAGIVENASKR